MRTRTAIAAGLLAIYIAAETWAVCKTNLPVAALADDWPSFAATLAALAGYLKKF